MEDVRGLKELQLDALREVANIGAGHAATALSMMTNHTIMIAVRELITRRACQRLNVARLSPMRVPPPMPCAIKPNRSTARATSRSRSDGDTCASRV